MKSLLISSIYFPPQTGGISRMMEQISRALGRERVCCLTGVKASPHDAHALDGIRVYRRPVAFCGNKYRQAFSLGRTLLEIALREHPRVLQVATCDDGHLALLAQRWLKLPYIVYAHGNEILAAAQSPWEKPRLALQRAGCVIANSRFTADLVARLGVPPEAIRVIPPGCDIERFRPVARNGRHAKGPVILTVGNLVERKGHDVIVRALPTIAQAVPGVTYMIVGDGPNRQTLEQLAAAVGMTDRVLFAGRVSDDDLPRFYAASDVFAMPSRARLEADDVEGFGLVYLEAGAAGLPVVAGRSGGVGDAVLHQVTGWLVDPVDTAEVAETLIRLLTNRDLRAELGRRARERVEQHHTWTNVATQVQEIVNCLGRGRSVS